MRKFDFGRLGMLLMLSVVAFGPAAHAEPDALSEASARAWADREVGGAVSSGQASAALVAVVSRGQVVIARSYGVFDPVTGAPVNTIHDQVIIASITKTVTATAIVQLWEAGKIRSLDDPANLYLKRFQLPNFQGKPVTLRELATHSSGLDSPGWGTSVQDQTAIPASGGYIRRKLPRLVRTPGRYAVYANFGPPILGAVIEDVSGERYDAYVARHILEPLGMNDSLIDYDPTGGPRLIHAGLIGARKPTRAPRMINAPYAAPAGSLQTTAPDMARYMLAQLGGAPEILSPRLISTMRSPQHVNYPGLPPIGFSFFLYDWNGAPVVTHGGNIEGFQSSLVLLPKQDVGVFVAFAGAPVGDARTADPAAATDKFLDRVLGPPSPRPAITPTVDPKSLSDRYWSDLRAHGTPESVYYWDSTDRVEPAPGGGLLIGAEDTPGRRFVEVAPRVFQGPVVNGRRPTLLAFDDGKMIRNSMYSSRVNGWDDPRVLAAASLNATAVALLGVLAVFSSGGLAKWLTVIAGLAAGVLAAAWIWPNLSHYDFNPEIIGGDGRRLLILRGLAWAFLLDGAALLALTVAAFFGPKPNPPALASAHRVVVASATLVLAFVAHQFCLY